MRTYRYDNRNTDEELYLCRHFSMTCEALGNVISLNPVIDIDYSNQNEPVYTRSSYIDGFALVQATFDTKYLVKGGWMQEDDEFKPILVHIPVVYDYELEVPELLDLAGEGHLLKIQMIDKTGLEETWVATQTRYSDDGTHWIMSVVPYRPDGRDEVAIATEGIVATNYQFLKG